MTSGPRDLRAHDYVGHMQDAIRLARSYIRAMDRRTFRAGRKSQQAVLMNLVIVGEAATRRMDRFPSFVARYPAVPWKSMRGMRNRLAHGYFDIDLDVVWDTVQHDLPSLTQLLGKIPPPRDPPPKQSPAA